MQVKVIMSEKEKKWAAVIGVLVLIVLYIINKRYMVIMDAEFEDGQPTSILIKTGFMVPVRTQVDMGKSAKVKFYDYTINSTPIGDTGEFKVDIFGSNKKVPRKSLTIHTDEYYTTYHKTPLGRI